MMKLKYKKIILLTAMSTMGIGMLTLSLSKDKPKAEESANISAILDTSISAEANTDDSERLMSVDSSAVNSAVTVAPTQTPTPTEIPVYPIEQAGTYPEIDKLFKTYYEAKNKRDIKTLKSILSDPSKVETEEELLAKTEYIDDYRKITTYTKKGLTNGTYIVYVYHEIKFTSINTPAPGLAKFYVTTSEDNKLKIYSGDLDSTTKAYFDARNNDEDVISIIKMTDKKSDKAKKQDEDLASFWKSIDKMSKKNTNKDTNKDTNNDTNKDTKKDTK